MTLNEIYQKVHELAGQVEELAESHTREVYELQRVLNKLGTELHEVANLIPQHDVKAPTKRITL